MPTVLPFFIAATLLAGSILGIMLLLHWNNR